MLCLDEIKTGFFFYQQPGHLWGKLTPHLNPDHNIRSVKHGGGRIMLQGCFPSGWREVRESWWESGQKHWKKSYLMV